MIRINQYDVIKLDDQGKYGWALMLGYEKDGEFKPKFCKREFGRDNEKTVPVSVPLGADPMATLNELLAQMSGAPDDDIPF